MLLSTFEAYFEGKKELFKGLAIEDLEKEWVTYPVLHLDLNARKYETPFDLVAMLNQHLEKWELLYGNEKQERSPEERFAYVIERASILTGRNVVVLIDEYDKPLLQAMQNEVTLEEAKKELAKRKTDVSKFSCHGMTFYKVEEYVIEENEFEYDEDENKFVQTDFIDTLESTEMKIEVVEIPSHETIAICSSLEEAEEAEDNYEGENETCIMI